MTQAALEEFQKQQSIPVTGIADAATWAALFPSSSTKSPLNIDEIRMGMMGSTVTDLYHVAEGKNPGVWVDAPYITFTNVYRVEPVTGIPTSSNSSVPVLDSTGKQQIGVIHAGDFVSASSTSPSNSLIAIQYTTNMVNGKVTLTSGYVSSKSYRLVKYNLPYVDVNDHVIN